jgi:actin
MLYPIENGIIEDFEQMEVLWEYTFVEQLKVNPTNHPLLLTEPPYNPKPNRERMGEIMFETFGVPCLNISIQGVLALLGQGRTTGLVLDSGEGVTNTIPIFDGFGLPMAINRLDMAGRELNTVMAKLLALEGICLTTTNDQYEVRCMKEKHCYVAQDPNSEFAETVNYNRPDGRVVPLGD